MPSGMLLNRNDEEPLKGAVAKRIGTSVYSGVKVMRTVPEVTSEPP